MNDEPSVTLLDEEPERARVQRELKHQLIAAGGLVVVMMLLFWFLGAITGGGTDVEVDDAPADTAAGADEQADGQAAGDEPQGEQGGEDDPSAGAAGGAASGPDESAGAPEASVPEPAPTPLVPPGEVSIQVIDGVIDDGGAAIDQLSAELSGAGYDVAAEAKSFRRYETTTVFYTQGHAVEGRQVADMLGLDTVSEKGSNLSSAVDVHVVVGQDRG